MTNTLYSVWTIGIDEEALVLVRNDELGVNDMRLVGYFRNQAYSIAQALEVVNGCKYNVASISKSEFTKRFGRNAAKIAFPA